MTDEMAPFRHLLKPKTKFESTEELEKAFHLSKENIVSKIKEGVAYLISISQHAWQQTSRELGISCYRKCAAAILRCLHAVLMAGDSA